MKKLLQEVNPVLNEDIIIHQVKNDVSLVQQRNMKDYKKYYIITASPEEVYLALTNPITIKLWTSEEAEMSTIAGTEFSLWDGAITGKNLEFEENRKIVQQWYFDEASDNSIVTLILHPHPSGTSVELRHTNIPDDDFDDIVEGWNSNYFGVLQEFYEE